MRLACLLLFACSAPLCTSRAETPADEVKHGDFHKEVAGQFKFAPPPVETPVIEISPVLIKPLVLPAGQTQVDDPDIVKMPTFTVTETIRNNNLHAAIQKSQALAQAKKVKFGTGVRELRLRHVTLSAVTIFYIPVAVGLSW